MSTVVPHPLVPRDFQLALFDVLHGASHPGVRATRRLVSACYVWRGMAAAVGLWAKQCVQCQWAKTHRHVHLQAAHIPVPTRRFAHLHVDLVGPLPASRGFTHIFTIIDRTTRWPEAIPLSSTSAADCAQALFSGWVARFGMLAIITSDQGAAVHFCPVVRPL